MKTYIKSEILNKYFAKGLNEITESLENIIESNKTEKEDLIEMDSEYVQIKKINLLYQDKLIILHNNIKYLNMDLEKNMIDFSCCKAQIPTTDFIQICEDIKTINIEGELPIYYYYSNNEFYVININILPNEYHVKENSLFTIDKIKHTFFPYMSKITQNLYKKVVFPIMKNINLDKNIPIVEPKFKILNIAKQINGYTYIKAQCIQDNQLVDITVLDSEVNNKNLIKDKLIKEYNNIKKFNENIINVGDV